MERSSASAGLGINAIVAPFTRPDLMHNAPWRRWLPLFGVIWLAFAVFIYWYAGIKPVADFLGQGVWRWTDSGGWQHLTNTDASLVSVRDGGLVAAEFPGQGVWRYEDATGWVQLTATDATWIGIAHDGNAVASFQAYGVWRWD